MRSSLTSNAGFVVVIPALDIEGELIIFPPPVGVWQLTVLTDRVILEATTRDLGDSLAQVVTALPGDRGLRENIVTPDTGLFVYPIPTLSCKKKIFFRRNEQRKVKKRKLNIFVIVKMK